MVACYSMVAAVLVKKPVMVGKVLSVTTSLEWESRLSSRFGRIGEKVIFRWIYQ